jgi:microcin C transport system permease protein
MGIALNPITRKRLARFRAHRRAFVSAWLLAAICLLCLGANLLCGNRPIVMRVNGDTYFPLWHRYSEATFIEGGSLAQPDYRDLATQPLFTEHARNWIVLPPVPYGAEEVFTIEALRGYASINARFEQEPPIATINIDTNGQVVAANQAGFFFACEERAVLGSSLTNTWQLPPSLHAAIAARFANTPSTRLTQTAPPVEAEQAAVSISLSSYSARRRPPRSVRLTLRQTDAAPASTHTVRVDSDGIVQTEQAFWELMSEADRTRAAALIEAGRQQAIDPTPFRVDGRNYTLRVTSEFAFPFPPTAEHRLGFDEAGHDVFARLLYALRISLVFGLLLVLASVTIGIVAGALKGYFGGWCDMVGQRFTEIWSTLPFLYVMMLVGSLYQRGFLVLLACYAIFNWIGISYYMRAEFLRLRTQPYVDAARAQGVGAMRIILRHILPNALTPIITFLPFYLVGAIGSLAALDYLGFGLAGLSPSLGELLQQGQNSRWAWWLTLYPSLVLFVIMLLGVFIGEGMRTAFDPRQRSRME